MCFTHWSQLKWNSYAVDIFIMALDPIGLFALLLAAPAAAAALSALPKGSFEFIASVAGAGIAVAASLAILATNANGVFGYFYSDGLTQIMAITISSIYLTSVLYSLFYLKHINQPLFRFRWYYSLVNLFAFTMLLSIVINDIGFIWIAVEATTVTSALLVALEREKTSIEAAWRYTLIVSAGLAISLLSVVLVYSSQGTLSISELLKKPIVNVPIMAIAVAFALVGYGTKAGIAPMHSWLPDAHSEAPSPISAMFSGILLPTSLYAYFRTFSILQSTSIYGPLRDLTIGFGIFTALVAAIIIGSQRNYKRMLAYSSMENMGIILVGFALGGIGTIGAVIQILAHAFAKSAAFYESGNVIAEYKSRTMADVQGLILRLRSTGYLFALTCLAVTGAPPFGVFVGEFLILAQAVSTGNYLLGILLAVAYMYAFIGLNRQSIQMIFGESEAASLLGTDALTREQNVSASEILHKNSAARSEDLLSVVLPGVNLAVSLFVGLYMIPALLHTATAFGL
jgi:hydrogenase-4 component F